MAAFTLHTIGRATLVGARHNTGMPVDIVYRWYRRLTVEIRLVTRISVTQKKGRHVLIIASHTVRVGGIGGEQVLVGIIEWHGRAGASLPIDVIATYQYVYWPTNTFNRNASHALALMSSQTVGR